MQVQVAVVMVVEQAGVVQDHVAVVVVEQAQVDRVQLN